MTPGPFLEEKKNVKKKPFILLILNQINFILLTKILISYFALKEQKGPERDFLIVCISWFDLHMNAISLILVDSQRKHRLC